MLLSWVLHKAIGQPSKKTEPATCPPPLHMASCSKPLPKEVEHKRLSHQLPCLLRDIEELHKVLFFLEVYPPLKSCYYNAKLDLGFSEESKVISCLIPTGLLRELDPKCFWLVWKTSSITKKVIRWLNKQYRKTSPELSIEFESLL